MINKLNFFISRPEFQKYGVNSLWLISEKILRLFVGLFVGIWVARYLGPEQFGLFSYVQSFAFIFMVIAGMGLDEILIRELVKDNEDNMILLGTAFWIKFFASLLSIFIIALAINLTTNDSFTSLLIFMIASSTIINSFNVIDFYFQSQVLSRYTVFSNIIVISISSLSKIILIILNAPLILFAFVVIFDAILLSIGLIFFYTKYLKLNLFKWSFSMITAKSLLRDSWPLVLASFVISIYMKIDQIMIKEIMSVSDVGQYAAALRISEAWYFIPIVICSSLFPAIIHAKEIDENLYLNRLQKLYSLMIWIGITVSILITFLGTSIIDILYGDQYYESASVLIIHIWAGVFVFLGVAFNKFLTVENFAIKTFYRTFSGAILNIILNLYLIPKYGINGAAIATLCSQLFTGLLIDIFDKELRKYFKFKLLAFNPLVLIK